MAVRKRSLNDAVWLAAFLFILIWFAKQIIPILLLFIFTLIISITLSAPVTWLEKKGLSRGWGTLVVTLGLLCIVAALSWLVIPIIIDQASTLISQIPDFTSSLQHRFSKILNRHPWLSEHFPPKDAKSSKIIDQLPGLLTGVLQTSLSALGTIVLLIAVISMTIYMVARPRPLLHAYISLFPPRNRDQASRALAKSSRMVFGWIKSHLVVGSIESIASFLFLTWMGVEGAIVWAAFVFFAELIPKLGPYVMAIPPILVALAADPLKALWVTLFYAVLNELTGDTIGPWVRGKEMDIQPALLILFMLIMGSAFGIFGALVATPLAGFVKAYMDEFYFSKFEADPNMENQIDCVLNRETGDQERKPEHSRKAA